METAVEETPGAGDSLYFAGSMDAAVAQSCALLAVAAEWAGSAPPELTFEVRSQPGAGTEIAAFVPIAWADEGLAAAARA
jgi:hypothetical protein